MIRGQRCCMCPNGVDSESMVCPATHGRDEVPCSFVRVFVDDRGWRFKVGWFLGHETCKGKYLKPGSKHWKGVAQLPHCLAFDDAQESLNRMAMTKGWRSVETDG